MSLCDAPFRAAKVAERLSAWLALVLIALPIHVKAQTESETEHVHASLRIESAPQCIPARALEDRVEAQLGRVVFVANPDVLVTLRMQAERDVLSLVIALTLPDGTPLGLRTLRTTGTDCRALDDELALVLALLIDLPEQEIALLIPPEPAPAATLERTTETLSLIHI